MVKGFKHSEETKEKLRKMNLKNIVSDPENYPKWRGGIGWLLKLEVRAGRKRPDKCELCSSEKRICFDHDHKTGKFRGWICDRCNKALGLVGDNIETLQLMIEYIKNNNSCE